MLKKYSSCRMDHVTHMTRGHPYTTSPVWRGGGGAKLTIWGDMRGVGVKKKSDIVNSRLADSDFLLQSFEIVTTTMQKGSLLDPVLDPFLAFMIPFWIFFYFFTYLFMSKTTPILHT